MATSTKAIVEYKQPLGKKHVILLQLSNLLEEEETQNAERSLLFSFGVFHCLRKVSKGECHGSTAWALSTSFDSFYGRSDAFMS